jgi:thymidine phosphorylase
MSSSSKFADFDEILLQLVSQAKKLGISEDSAHDAIHSAFADEKAADKKQKDVAEKPKDVAEKPKDVAEGSGAKPMKAKTEATLMRMRHDDLALYVSEAVPCYKLEDLLAKKGKSNLYTKDDLITLLRKERPELVKSPDSSPSSSSAAS